ncbi:uncharacterized protein NPIL_240541 [Nephila pilipes]|uniref:Mutator-like transposase domain-containing protein n=1 Tax=Nephila pilipes TaxID=299642 RepID=A0A8X6N467_NEPPI|nr:uncharacterized protein NPIL_240541 [Nephila pilipes]
MRCIGKGAESAVMFCGIMNLPPPPTKFTNFNNNLLQAARETCEESMAEAVHEAVEENEGGRDIAVAVDGSWQKRGFSSKNGVVTVTSVDTGKVIDVEILSKHCICPNKTKHLQNCTRNFVGYSGKMEVTEKNCKYQILLQIPNTSEYLRTLSMNGLSEALDDKRDAARKDCKLSGINSINITQMLSCIIFILSFIQDELLGDPCYGFCEVSQELHLTAIICNEKLLKSAQLCLKTSCNRNLFLHIHLS